MKNSEKTKIQKEIVDLLDPKPHGRLLLAPRLGKTKLVIDIIKKNKPESILWVTPMPHLAEVEIPEEFETWKAKKFLPKLKTTTWKSLNKIKGHFTMIILDEEQFATENNTEHLISGELSADYIISMTGAQTKHENKNVIYDRLNLPVLYKFDINEAVDTGILSNYTIKVVEIPMSTEMNIQAGNAKVKFLTSEEANYKYLTKSMMDAINQKRFDAKFKILGRMRAVYNSPSKTAAAINIIQNLKGRKLIFSASIDQAEKLSKNTYHSKTDNTNLKAFIKGDIDEVAMVNTGGVGTTYKSVDHLFMTQADSDKNGLTTQKICRTLLYQEGYEATIWILCLVGTQDEKWVKSALENFDQSKVEYIRYDNLKQNYNVKEN